MHSIAVSWTCMCCRRCSIFTGSKFFESGVVIFVAVFFIMDLDICLDTELVNSRGMNTAKNNLDRVGMQNAGLATNLQQQPLRCTPGVSNHLCSILYMAFYFRNTPCRMFAYYDKFKRTESQECEYKKKKQYDVSVKV